MKGNNYNHGASNKGEKSCNYAEPKPIGASVPKPTPDMSTPMTGKGHANGSGWKKK